MSIQILPNELAEIITALLIKPDYLGELDSNETHMRFFNDLGELVADYCGGCINGVSEPDFPPGTLMTNRESTLPMLSVSPNESLPSMLDSVWSLYDEEGWREYLTEEQQQQLSLKQQQFKEIRKRVRRLLSR